jgi:hypothetical protein
MTVSRQPAQPRAGVERVEVPVTTPVDDSTGEAVQVAAAALGAALAAVATTARRQRGRNGTSPIDHTGAVRP